jgi:hypothetical protein
MGVARSVPSDERIVVLIGYTGRIVSVFSSSTLPSMRILRCNFSNKLARRKKEPRPFTSCRLLSILRSPPSSRMRTSEQLDQSSENHG